MNYDTLVRTIGAKTTLGAKTIDKVLDALRDVVHNLEVGDSVTLPKLGAFHAKMRNPRKVTTLSGNVVEVPARRAVTFRQTKSKAA